MFKSKLFNALVALLVVAQVGVAQKLQKPAAELAQSGSKHLSTMADTLKNKIFSSNTHMVANLGAMKQAGGNGTYFVNAAVKDFTTLNIGGKKRAGLGFSMGDISLETMPKDTFDTKFAVGPILEVPILKAGKVEIPQGNNILTVPNITVDAYGKIVKTLAQCPGQTTAYQFGVPVRFNTVLPKKPKAPTGGSNPPRKPIELIYGEIAPTYTDQSYLAKKYVDGKVYDKTNHRSGFGVRCKVGANVSNNTEVYLEAGTPYSNRVLTRVAGPYVGLGTQITL